MADFDNLCMNCMADIAGQTECSHCGCHSDKPQMQHAIPLRAMLQNRYLVGYAKKSNGEGFTYIGYDTVLNIPVEIHEFFPQTLSQRVDKSGDIRIIGGSELIFNECLAKFLSYSRDIAHMRELSVIIQIYDIFEENHTAYTISEWNDSITLRYFVKRSGGSLGWNAARQLFMPVLSALSILHANNIMHLGISPDTLYIMKNGKMKLGSFSISTVRRMDTDLPPDLKPGCAAIEQYVMDYTPNESTDVYGFAASIFFALTGSLPPDALKRRTNARLLIPNSILRSLPPYVVTALANALQVSPSKRTPTFERLRAELSASPNVTAAIEQSQSFHKVAQQQPKQPAKAKKKEVPGFVWVLASCFVMLIIFAGVGLIWINQSTHSGDGGNLMAAGTVSGSKSSSDESSQSSDVSSKAGMIDTPDLVGQNYKKLVSDSSKNSSNEDYQVLLSSKQFSDTIPEGYIISQKPEQNTQMTKGTAVVVVVSEGAAVRTLPQIAGKTLSEASAAVTSDGFVPTKAEAYSDTVEAGKVIGYKDVKEGSQMAYGSSVIIIVSKGPDSSKSSDSTSAASQ